MTPLLLLPGMMCDFRLFTSQIEAIKDRDVIVPSIATHDNVELIASTIIESAPPIFALAGLSMGGIVAMEIVRQAPERVERLCLMDTNPLAEAEDIKAKREPQIEKVMNGGLEDVMRNEMIPNYFAEGQSNKERIELCWEMAEGLGMDVFIKQSRALQTRRDQTDTLESYKGPTLILHGENDRLCPAHRHELMHKLLPHSQYIIISGAGHLPTIEMPLTTNQHLNNWLS